jgi:5-methylcytosine-specific restriction endonuclease McrA
MARSLVLNATDEPLSIVSTRRAAVLVLGEKADVVHADDGWLRSEHRRLPVPSVVRLRYFVRVPFPRRAALNRRAVFARDDHRCQYCHGPAESIDHIVPRSRGGGHDWGNVVAACRPCNVRKRDRYLEDTTMRLRSTPRAPRQLSWLVVAMGDIPEQWVPYVRAPALVG